MKSKKNEAKLLLNVMRTYVDFMLEQIDSIDVDEDQLNAVKFARETMTKTFLLLNEEKEGVKIGF